MVVFKLCFMLTLIIACVVYGQVEGVSLNVTNELQAF